MRKKKLVLLAALAALFSSLGLGAPAEAATITINSTADTVADDGVCTLREAVTAANTDLASGASAGECAAGSGADTLVTTAALAGATINLSTVGDTTIGPSALRVDTSITLEGGASGLTISRSGSGPIMRLFYVAAGSLVLRDLTLRDGRANGFTGGRTQRGGQGGGSAGMGGAIFSEGAITLERCTLTANGATGGAGASFVGGGSRGGGGGAGLLGNGFNAPISATTIDGGAGGPSAGGAGGTPASPPGTAGGLGGGGGGGGVNDSTGTGAGGAGGFGGGGGGGGAGRLSDSNPGGTGGAGGFGGGGGGGGLGPTQGVGGDGGFGGGRGGNAAGDSLGGSGGGGAGLGGAIFARAGSVTTTRSTFQGNIAVGGAAGVSDLGSGSGNSGQGLGGAIFVFTGVQLTATNCTFSTNNAPDGGGGVFNYNGIASIAHSTFSGNQAGAGTGGGIASRGDGATADLQLNNTIVANSTGTDVVAAAFSGGTSTTSGNGNLIESQSGFAGGITSTADPGLTALANNGGLTQTHAIGLTSPALDAGLNAGAPATDQRGRPRILDGNGDTVATIDIGAYELETADLRITKTDGVTTAVPGQTTVYTIVASNAGPTSVPSTTVTDTFPASLSCSWTSVSAGGASGNTNGSGNLTNTLNLPVGGSVTYTVTCSISPAATGTLSNTATITSSLPDPVSGNNSATDTTTLVPTANLAITKTDGVTSAVPGQTTVYTIVASNAGPSNAPSSSVSDTFPASLSCSWTSVAAGGATGNTNGSGNLSNTLNLPAGSSVTYTATCNINPAATGTLSNTATITSSVTDPVPGNNSATDTTTLNPTADVSITKTDGVTTAVPGQTTVYTLVASNTGPSTDPAATVSDTFPASLSCSWTSVAAGGATGNTNGSGNLSNTLNLPAGSSVTYTATCNINPTATGTLSNTATITSSVTDPVPGNNSATDTTTLNPTADVSITKTDGVTTAVPGQTTVYMIVASNTGPSTDPAATVSDTFPASLSCSWTSVAAGGATGNTNGSGNLTNTLNLPAGSSVTYTATCNINPAATGTLSNTATITSSVTDPVPGNNSATDTTTLNPTADVSITKTDGVTTAVPGQTTVYTLVASNTGPSTDPAVTVSDTFPTALACSWTSVAAGGATGNTNGSGNLTNTLSLPAGSSVTYTATCTIDPTATGTLSNTATVASSVTDPVPGNNSATDTTSLTPTAEVAITKSDGVATAVPGEVLTYTLVATNSGPSAAPGTSVTDTFPAGLSSIAWTCVASAGSTCAAAGSGNIADTANLAPGGTATYTALATVDAGFVGAIVNSATLAVAAGVTDPSSANNSATDSTQVASPALVSGTKEVAGTFVPGEVVTYTLTLVNSSTEAQLDNPGDELFDVLPASLLLLAASADSGVVSAALPQNTVRWNGSIPGGGLVQIVIEARIADGIGMASISNQATIFSDADGDGSNELESVTDDPAASGTDDPTSFQVLGTVEIPTLDTWGFLALALGLAWLALRRLRRLRSS